MIGLATHTRAFAYADNGPAHLQANAGGIHNHANLNDVTPLLNSQPGLCRNQPLELGLRHVCGGNYKPHPALRDIYICSFTEDANPE